MTSQSSKWAPTDEARLAAVIEARTVVAIGLDLDTVLGLLLERVDDMEPVGEAGDARQALEMARPLKPDVVVIPDLRMAPRHQGQLVRPRRGFPIPGLGVNPDGHSAVSTDARTPERRDHVRMISTHPYDTPPTELSSRTSDGIDVALFWTPGVDRLRVAVVDTKLNHAFALSVDADNALRAFHHPYAYAAERGIRVGQSAMASPTSCPWAHAGVGGR